MMPDQSPDLIDPISTDANWLPSPQPTHQGRRRMFGRLEWMFVILTCFLAGAACLTMRLIVDQQATLGRVSRYNVTWLLSQAPLEVIRLQDALAESAMPGADLDRDEIGLRLDIVRNRLDLMTQGDAGRFVNDKPDRVETVAAFRSMLNEVQDMLDKWQPGQPVAPMVDLIAPVVPKLIALGGTAYNRVGDLVAQDQAELSSLQAALSYIVVGLITCGLVLLWIVVWHNRQLREAKGEVDILLGDLKQKANELQQANMRRSATMGELVRQNRLLERRDLELAEQIERFDAALNNMSQALCMVDNRGHLTVCNRRFLELWNLPSAVAKGGLPIKDVLRMAATSVSYQPAMITEIWNMHQQLFEMETSGRFFREDDCGRAVAVAHEPMTNGGWVATYEDITERRRSEARIQFMAHHDTLTGLPNRALFKERLEKALNEWVSRGETAAILYLDIDDFKTINDTLGHPVGDRMLEAVARRLQAAVKGCDTVARLGGDEFAVIAHCDWEGAAALAKRLVADVMEPFEFDGNRVEIGTSIGLAMAPVDGCEAVQLLKCADMALYRAKGEGRGSFRFFEPDMDLQLRARRGIELDLREALEQSGLALHYQPLLDLTENRIRGCEALLRWQHPTKGFVSPSQFIPIAENAGMIVRIGEWALRQACQDALAWPDDVKVAVNLSPWQFASPNLFDAVREALEESGLPPHRLELEITESALIKDSEKVHSILHRLRALGVGTALDDFGTGYSSLSYLRSFPFDKIKIDRCFVSEMQTRADCLAIVQSVAELARRLGMATTAEGVETVEQLSMVRAAGCTQAQGYLIDKAQRASDVSIAPRLIRRPLAEVAAA